MTSKLITYRTQFFIISMSVAIFSFQLEPFLTSRGISTTTVMTIFSIAQVLSLVFTLAWARIVHKSNHGHSILRVGYILRICVIGFMFICFNSALLICLVLMYYTVASSIDIANEARVMKWASEENQKFGRIRGFGSLGFALSGLVATAIVALTGKIDFVILFAFFINVVLVALSFYRPVLTPSVNQKADSKVKLGISTILMLIFVTISMSLTGCFYIIMNYHLREGLGLSLEGAVLFCGIAVLFGQGFSEMPMMANIHKFIEKFGARNVVLIGLCTAIVRWTIASVAHSPLLLSATFLLHGIFFSCTYIGFSTLIRQRLGNDAISKVLTSMSISISVFAMILSQIFNYFIQHYDTFMILKFYVIISIICAISFAVISKKSMLRKDKCSV